jgi:hypothetical protein
MVQQSRIFPNLGEDDHEPFPVFRVRYDRDPVSLTGAAAFAEACL